MITFTLKLQLRSGYISGSPKASKMGLPRSELQMMTFFNKTLIAKWSFWDSFQNVPNGMTQVWAANGNVYNKILITKWSLWWSSQSDPNGMIQAESRPEMQISNFTTQLQLQSCVAWASKMSQMGWPRPGLQIITFTINWNYNVIVAGELPKCPKWDDPGLSFKWSLLPKDFNSKVITLAEFPKCPKWDNPGLTSKQPRLQYTSVAKW